MAHQPVRTVGQGGGVACAWTCREEWEEVYSWLYSSEPTLVKKGVGRVCAWKSRGHVPMMVEMTADLCECRVQERSRERGGAHFQALALQYSMAITRFVNGVGDIVKDKLQIIGSLISCVDKYGIPSWIVTLRHCGTHEKLPSLGALRAGAEFCLSWLRANYWRPQRLTIGERVGGPRSRTATPPMEVEDEEDERGSEVKESHVWRLTHGLCGTRDELVTTLVSSHYSDLKEYLVQKQLLQFPPSFKFRLDVPPSTDLDSLCCLSVAEKEMKVWQTHLRKAASRSSSFKQRLVSALMCSVNDSSCEASLRDFLCGWLSILLHSVQQRLCVIKVLEEGDVEEEVSGFIPGELDWMELVKVAKLFPGYYSHPIMKVILSNLSSVLSENVRKQVLQLSSLVTLSSRIHQHMPDLQTPPTGCDLAEHHAPYLSTPQCRKLQNELTTLKTLLQRKLNSSLSAEVLEVGVTGGRGQEGSVRWAEVQDMSVWLECPLGQCPGQLISADMFELDQLSSSFRQGLGTSTLSGVEKSPATRQDPESSCDDPGLCTGEIQTTDQSPEEGSDEETPPNTFRLDKQQIQKLKQTVRIL